MKRAFIYKDEKSHKFWWIDYSGWGFSVPVNLKSKTSIQKKNA